MKLGNKQSRIEIGATKFNDACYDLIDKRRNKPKREREGESERDRV